MTEPTGEVAAPTVVPWASASDVPQGVREQVDPVVLDASLVQASQVLWALTGRRWGGAGQEREVLLAPVPCGCGAASGPHLPAYLYNSGTTGPLLSSYRVQHGAACRGHHTYLDLPDYPVTSVVSLHDGTLPLQVSAVTVEDGRRLVLLRDDVPQQWPYRRYTVRYRFGIDPPAGGRSAAATYAAQLALARTPDAEGCKLPARVQTVTRQGVTLAMLDPMDFLDKGRTGLPDVDTWVVSVNPDGLRSRPQVWSPDVAPTTMHYRRP